MHLALLVEQGDEDVVAALGGAGERGVRRRSCRRTARLSRFCCCGVVVVAENRALVRVAEIAGAW